MLVGFIVLALISPAEAKSWTTDYTQSSITFSGKQSGQAFEGKFKKFETVIDFDPAKPATGKITAHIDIASAFTGSDDIDSSLPQSAWFDSSKFPKAEFVSTTITAAETPSCFKADGNLTIKGVSKPITLPFCLATEGDHVRAKGSINLTRTDFNIGTGQWTSEATVAHAVMVNLDIVAR